MILIFVLQRNKSPNYLANVEQLNHTSLFQDIRWLLQGTIPELAQVLVQSCQQENTRSPNKAPNSS